MFGASSLTRYRHPLVERAARHPPLPGARKTPTRRGGGFAMCSAKSDAKVL